MIRALRKGTIATMPGALFDQDEWYHIIACRRMVFRSLRVYSASWHSLVLSGVQICVCVQLRSTASSQSSQRLTEGSLPSCAQVRSEAFLLYTFASSSNFKDTEALEGRQVLSLRTHKSPKFFFAVLLDPLTSLKDVETSFPSFPPDISSLSRCSF